MGSDRRGEDQGSMDMEVRIAKVMRRGRRFTRVRLTTGEDLLLETVERPRQEGDFYSYSYDYGAGIRERRDDDSPPQLLWEYL